MACQSKSTVVTLLTSQSKIQLKILENMFFNAQKRVFEPQKPLDMFPESIWMREKDFKENRNFHDFGWFSTLSLRLGMEMSRFDYYYYYFYYDYYYYY